MPQQHPLFIKYKRDWLHEITGYSKGYLSRVARGRTSLSRSFIERVCFKLNQPEEDLFCLTVPKQQSTASQPSDRE
jgi:transcriptional regulator with XRE-family HTH domain